MLRPVVMGKNGLVASAHPLASLAGIEVLKEGGNAFDAIVAANAVLGVVHPHQCGLGGDAFYLFYSAEKKKVFFLNGSGRSPFDASIETIRRRGYEQVPRRGVLSVTVPGCVHAWGELLRTFGSKTFARLLQPAASYAREGVALTHYMAEALEKQKEVIKQDSYLRQVFMRSGRVLRAGEVVRQEPLAATLELIGREGAAAFYQGEIARKIQRFMRRKNGLMSQQDLEMHTSTWSEPISVSYGGFRIYQSPPNTQGLAALLAFNILEGLDLTNMGCDTAEMIHHLVEAKKIAYQYREQYITDPEFVPVETDDLLDKQYASRLRKLIHSQRALMAYSRSELPDNTAFSAAGDREGNLVAGIQSIYGPFGAGCTVEETGIILQNRGSCFSLDPVHINRLEPHKRTFHTSTASIVTRDNRPLIAFGVSGADSQPQTHLQVLTKLMHFGFNIQDAIEAPR